MWGKCLEGRGKHLWRSTGQPRKRGRLWGKMPNRGEFSNLHSLLPPPQVRFLLCLSIAWPGHGAALALWWLILILCSLASGSTLWLVWSDAYQRVFCVSQDSRVPVKWAYHVGRLPSRKKNFPLGSCSLFSRYPPTKPRQNTPGFNTPTAQSLAQPSPCWLTSKQQQADGRK